MKKILLLIVFLMIYLMPLNVSADNKVTIYFFRSNNCEHCEAALDYMKSHQELFEDYEVITYQVYNNKVNANLQDLVEEELDLPKDDRGKIPLFVIGNQYKQGYSSVATMNEILDIAKSYVTSDEYVDLVAKVKDDNSVKAKGIALKEMGPNKVVTAIVFSIFGILVLGFAGMILFSRK